MSAKRWDICVPEKSKDGDKTYWTKIGVMFPRDAGGFVIHIAYPGAELYAFEPKERDQERQTATRQAPVQTGADPEAGEHRHTAADEPADEADYDDIPF